MRSDEVTQYANMVGRYLDSPSHAPEYEKQALELKTVGQLLQDKQLTQAEALLNHLNIEKLPDNLHTEKLILEANLALLQGYEYRSLNILNQIESTRHLSLDQQRAYYELLSQANEHSGNYILSAEALMELDPLLQSKKAQIENNDKIWKNLNQLSIEELSTQIHYSMSEKLTGWLEFIYIKKVYDDNPDLLANEQKQWRHHYPKHPANSLIPKFKLFSRLHNRGKQMVSASHSYKPLSIALLLPTTGAHEKAGKAIKSGFMTAYYQQQNSFYAPTRINTYNTDNTNIQALYHQAVADGANVIIGPLIKSNVAQIASLGSVPVPTLGLNIVSASRKQVKNLFEFALSPQDEAYQVAKRMLKDGFEDVIIIAPNSQWGQGIAKTFQQTFVSGGGNIVDTLAYGKTSTLDLAIKKILKVDNNALRRPQKTEKEDTDDLSSPRRDDFSAIFLVANPQVARQIKSLLKFYFTDNAPVYATSEIYTGKPDPGHDKDLNGIIFCDMPWTLNTSSTVQQAKQTMLEIAANISTSKERLYAYGLDAYTLATHMNPFRLQDYYSIDGFTGNLYLSHHHIYRQLEWAQFTNGYPKHISN